MCAASNESPVNLVRGPAKKPEWAQLIRLGGDRVAILFGELRKSVGSIDGIVESLEYSENEARWVVQYGVGGRELFAARISPGLLEAGMSLSRSEFESLLGMQNLSSAIKEAIRSSKSAAEAISLPLTDRRTVRLFANLVKVRNKLQLKATRPIW